MKSKGWSSSDIRELEERASTVPIAAAKLLLSRSAVESVSAATAMMAMETHDYTLYKGKLMASPYVNKNGLVV